MEQDTTALREWLNAIGHGNVPLDINEFGAGDGVTPGVAAWGTEVAQYTQWALCTPALDVENVQPFWWGAIPTADNDPWVSMVNSELSETPLGTAYLGEVQSLTTQGCPLPPASTPSATPRAAATHAGGKSRKATRRLDRRRRSLRVPRRRGKGGGAVGAIALRKADSPPPDAAERRL
jgi:hypothetical protein